MSFEQIFVKCASPALCGIKSASLFSMNIDIYGNGSEKLEELMSYFSEKGIFIFPIQKKDNRMLFFVYNRKLLRERCSSKKAIQYLKEKNYPVTSGFDSILLELLSRLMTNKTFPHEVGFFLGYPLEDVIQFEVQHGNGFKFCGDWKVYGNLKDALVQMNEYKNCRNYCSSQLEKGFAIPQVALNYRKQLKKL